jgi:hydrogenase assembly chaperone HypC/HupF
MCLGVPGKVIQIEENAAGVKTGKVTSGDATRDVMLSVLPEVHVGDYVMVQYGMATSRLDEDEVEDILAFVRNLDELNIGEELK